MKTMIGIIGGSGVYEIAGIEGGAWTPVETPWGRPSDEILTGRLDDIPVAFLPRHGRGHVHSPASVPYRANIDALKRLGCTDLVSVSACGSFREELAPGDFVLLDQYIDRTVGRASSFFGEGCVAHVAFAHPTCTRLSDLCAAAAAAAGVHVHRGGTYLAMEGPQFSTIAESRMYRELWGAHVIGMTGMPEAKLAREAELCYAAIAMITDYDSWHPGHDSVDVAMVVRTLVRNAANARALVAALPALACPAREPCPHGCDRALDHALMTAPARRDPAVLSMLDAVAGRVLGLRSAG